MLRFFANSSRSSSRRIARRKEREGEERKERNDVPRANHLCVIFHMRDRYDIEENEDIPEKIFHKMEP